jgi:molecular chaperone GrpE
MNNDRRTETPEPAAGSGDGTETAGSADGHGAQTAGPAAGRGTQTAGRADGDGTQRAGDGDETRRSDEAHPPPNVPAGEPEAPVAPPSGPVEDDGEEEPGAVPGSPADQDPETESDVGALQAKAAKADEYLELAQRTRAEFENYRRRATKEAAAAQERGAAKLALELLPAIDNLDRALAHADAPGPDGGDDSLAHGIKHVHSDVLAALKRVGIEPFSPEGERFDPQLHEAVAQQPQEGVEPGVVVEVYQRGYRRGESVLRPARVVVAG